MNRPCRVGLPGGRTVELPSPRRDENVAEWLERGGVPLNTRCGGRGLCRGCVVKTASGQSLRACQTRGVELGAFETLEVPRTSYRDASLHGVSDFEIRGSLAPARLRKGLGLALDIGTTTLAGASAILLAGGTSPLDTARSQTTVVELNRQPSFEDHFTDNLCLPEPPDGPVSAQPA